MDDIKSSHKDPRVNNEFLEWLREQYGDSSLGEVEFTRGKRYEYLGMTLDYATKGKLKIDMSRYMDETCISFPEKLSGVAKHPWNEIFFSVNEDGKQMMESNSQIFHTTVMKSMFLTKRGRPDILHGVCFLSTCVSKPTRGDWNKLKKIMNFLKYTRNDILISETDNNHGICWFISASFGLYSDCKSHTRACCTIGGGMICTLLNKKKNDSRNPTKGKLNAVDDKVNKTVTVKRFLKSRGFNVNQNTIKQDNESAIKLESNATECVGKRLRHFNIKLFYINNLKEQGELNMEYCHTRNMVADYFSKPFTSTKFDEFRKIILNI